MNNLERQEILADIRKDLRPDSTPRFDITTGNATKTIDDDQVAKKDNSQHTNRNSSYPVWYRHLFANEKVVFEDMEKKYEPDQSEGEWVFDPNKHATFVHRLLINGKYLLVNLSTGVSKIVADRGEAEQEIQFWKN